MSIKSILKQQIMSVLESQWNESNKTQSDKVKSITISKSADVKVVKDSGKKLQKIIKAEVENEVAESIEAIDERKIDYHTAYKNAAKNYGRATSSYEKLHWQNVMMKHKKILDKLQGGTIKQ